jgi:TusA-related sulfurtransferase
MTNKRRNIKMKTDIVMDTKGMACPMPIVKAKKALDGLESGQVMEVQSTDKGSINDFQAWVKQTKHELLKHEEDNGIYKFFVKKV